MKFGGDISICIIMPVKLVNVLNLLNCYFELYWIKVKRVRAYGYLPHALYHYYRMTIGISRGANWNQYQWWRGLSLSLSLSGIFMSVHGTCASFFPSVPGYRGVAQSPAINEPCETSCDDALTQTDSYGLWDAGLTRAQLHCCHVYISYSGSDLCVCLASQTTKGRTMLLEITELCHWDFLHFSFFWIVYALSLSLSLSVSLKRDHIYHSNMQLLKRKREAERERKREFPDFE